ncbi:MAG: hypothetical protein EOL95_08240 [Bacteroidia bacterium]|nr:hypothetical protein [Bacteroidia bacterium]
MKTIIYIFLVTFLFCSTDLNAQCQIHIDTISFCYFNGITKQSQIIDNYQITNNSTEDYLTWVSLVPKNDKSNIELTHDFFKKGKGDFNLIEAMYENLLDGRPIIIGYSFIKNITVGETFSYFIAKTETKSNFYQRRIVLIKKKEVEQYLRMQIDEKYFFKLPSIFLTEK